MTAVQSDAGGPSLFFFHTNADYLCGLRLPMLQALVGHGYRVSAFAPDMGTKQQEILAANRIVGRRYPLDAAGFNPLHDLRDMWRLSRLLRKESPEVVFTNNIKPVVFGTVAAALAGTARRYALVGGLGFAFIEDMDGPAARSRRIARVIASLLYAVAFRLARQVIFHNRDDLEMLRAARICPATKGTVVAGSGVDVARFRPVPRAPGARFVFVGRLLADKGVREFLRAAEAAKRVVPEATFTVVGGVDPNPASIQEDEIRGYVDSGVVEWKGSVSDVKPYLDQATVFVLPSYREGVPRSTLEALASGLAVITADSPGCRETVVPGVNGLMVPVRDAKALAEAMVSLCRDPVLVEEMGRASRRLAEERFSVERVNREIIAQLEMH